MSGPADATPTLYRQVLVESRKDDARLYQLLVDCIRYPEVADAVESMVFRRSSSAYFGAWPTKDHNDEALRDVSNETLFTNALRALELGDELQSWVRALTWMDPDMVHSRSVLDSVDGAIRRAQHGGNSNSDSFGVRATILLFTLCPNVEHFTYELDSSSELEIFLKRNNYNRLSRQFLQKLKHVTLLPSRRTLLRQNDYADGDPLGAVLTFHRLPQIETFSIRTVKDDRDKIWTFTAVPRTSTLKSINIANSLISSQTLAAIIRVPRALERFRYSCGGDWSVRGGSTFNAKTIGKALWTQRESLQELWFLCDGTLTGSYGSDSEDEEDIVPDWDEEEPRLEGTEQHPDVILDRELEVGGPAPLCHSKLPTTRKYKDTIGSLHDFTSLKRLSIGARFLLGPGTKMVDAKPAEWKDVEQADFPDCGFDNGHGIDLSKANNRFISVPNVWTYDTMIQKPPYSLVDALPQSLEFLQIHGYERGKDASWDKQIDELLELKAEKLPNLKTIVGLETRLWSDADYTSLLMRRRRYPEPRRALTSYIAFIGEKRPEISAAHPDWSRSQKANELDRMWVALPLEEKNSLQTRYHVNVARWAVQKRAWDAKEAIPEIDDDEAERLYAEHLRFGNVVPGQKGLRVLTHAVKVGNPRVMGQEEIARIKMQVEEEKKVADEASRKVLDRVYGPTYEWVEADSQEDPDWVKVGGQEDSSWLKTQSWDDLHAEPVPEE